MPSSSCPDEMSFPVQFSSDLIFLFSFSLLYKYIYIWCINKYKTLDEIPSFECREGDILSDVAFCVFVEYGNEGKRLFAYASRLGCDQLI